MKRILITGGNGYIATSIYSALSKNYEITRMTRNDFNLCNYDETRSWFKNKEFDVVIHTAIKGGNRLQKESSTELDENLQMYYNLLSNRSSFDRFINIGSGAEFSSIDTAYGLSKRVIRESILEKNGFYNLRVFAVFDEYELDRRFIKSNLYRYINHEPMVIHQDKRMDFFYMPDFIKVVAYYIDNQTLHKEFDCTYSYTYYLSEIAEKINKLSDYQVPIQIQSKSFGDDYLGKNNPIDVGLIGLDEGIKHTYKSLCRT